MPYSPKRLSSTYKAGTDVFNRSTCRLPITPGVSRLLWLKMCYVTDSGQLLQPQADPPPPPPLPPPLPTPPDCTSLVGFTCFCVVCGTKLAVVQATHEETDAMHAVNQVAVSTVQELADMHVRLEMQQLEKIRDICEAAMEDMDSLPEKVCRPLRGGLCACLFTCATNRW